MLLIIIHVAAWKIKGIISLPQNAHKSFRSADKKSLTSSPGIVKYKT